MKLRTRLCLAYPRLRTEEYATVGVFQDPCGSRCDLIEPIRQDT